MPHRLCYLTATGLLLVVVVFPAGSARGQGSLEDYQRADALRAEAEHPSGPAVVGRRGPVPALEHLEAHQPPGPLAQRVEQSIHSNCQPPGLPIIAYQ